MQVPVLHTQVFEASVDLRANHYADVEQSAVYRRKRPLRSDFTDIVKHCGLEPNLTDLPGKGSSPQAGAVSLHHTITNVRFCGLEVLSQPFRQAEDADIELI